MGSSPPSPVCDVPVSPPQAAPASTRTMSAVIVWSLEIMTVRLPSAAAYRKRYAAVARPENLDGCWTCLVTGSLRDIANPGQRCPKVEIFSAPRGTLQARGLLLQAVRRLQ